MNALHYEFSNIELKEKEKKPEMLLVWTFNQGTTA